MKLRKAEVRLLSLLLFPLIFSAVALGSVRPGSPGYSRTALVFSADSDKSTPIFPKLFDSLRRELDQDNGEYPLPVDPYLLAAAEVRQGQEFSQLIGVHLIGRCDVVQQAYRSLKPGPLGWVLRVAGEIQPFIYVDCTRLAQFLNPRTLGLNREQRDAAMAQAISRIILHEWIHIATQSAAHGNEGLRRAELTAPDLAPATRMVGGR